MKGELIFRNFVGISSYPYEFFVLGDFIICSVSFVVVHLRSVLGKGLLKARSIQ